MVVVDEQPHRRYPRDLLAEATTDSERRAVMIVDLDLSIGCRHKLHRLGLSTLGELLQQPHDSLRSALGESSSCFEQVQALLAHYGMEWDS